MHSTNSKSNCDSKYILKTHVKSWLEDGDNCSAMSFIVRSQDDKASMVGVSKSSGNA
jgi:hypothetical protein